jgi:hypothetical protein
MNVGQDHGAVFQPGVEHARSASKLRHMAPKPPTAPSSIVISASWWRASCRIISSSSGLAKRASAMVGVRPRAAQRLGRLLHLLQPRAEIQERDAVALADHPALADLQRFAALGHLDAHALAARVAERDGARSSMRGAVRPCAQARPRRRRP